MLDTAYSPPMGEPIKTYCRICEAACGLEVEANGRELKIRPDREHPVSRGFVCAKGTRFIVGRGPAHEPVRSGIEPGRRFRLNGKKDVINDIKKQEGHMIEVTGLVRQADLAGPGGVQIGGARISGGPAQGGMADARRNTGSLDPVLDVESFRLLAEGCSVR